MYNLSTFYTYTPFDRILVKYDMTNTSDRKNDVNVEGNGEVIFFYKSKNMLILVYEKKKKKNENGF